MKMGHKKEKITFITVLGTEQIQTSFLFVLQSTFMK